jgi:nucleotide-binding universal stress UspA family protein
MNSVIAAIDLGPSSAHVLYHAAGFARMLSARLCVLHVTSEPAEGMRQEVLDFCVEKGPYEIDLGVDDVVVRNGQVSEAIYREAAHQQAGLIVMGVRDRGGISRRLLGSTSDAVLRNAAVPVLLVPPTDFDIVNISDRASLTSGPVLAAIDRNDFSARQLRLAGRLAAASGQALLLMTVAPRTVDEHDASARLRQHAHELNGGVKPHAMIVRRGGVAEEISRCAVTEGAGLVVMGLRGRGRPGAIASAVLRTKRAFVLAVPHE